MRPVLKQSLSSTQQPHALTSLQAALAELRCLAVRGVMCEHRGDVWQNGKGLSLSPKHFFHAPACPPSPIPNWHPHLTSESYSVQGRGTASVPSAGSRQGWVLGASAVSRHAVAPWRRGGPRPCCLQPAPSVQHPPYTPQCAPSCCAIYMAPADTISPQSCCAWGLF